jgi:predicted nucleic acid-binding Zn ribbon protein
MPLYDYSCPECKECDHVRELQLSMDHKKPKCEKDNCDNILSRVFTRAPSFKFVGAGFYSNDYKETNYDRMTNSQKDSFDSEQVDKLDEKYSAEEKAFKQKIKDDLR